MWLGAVILLSGQAVPESPPTPRIPEPITVANSRPPLLWGRIGTCEGNGRSYNLRELRLLESHAVNIAGPTGLLRVSVAEEYLQIRTARSPFRPRYSVNIGDAADPQGGLDVELKLGYFDGAPVVFWKEAVRFRIYRQGMFRVTSEGAIPLCAGRGGVTIRDLMGYPDGTEYRHPQFNERVQRSQGHPRGQDGHLVSSAFGSASIQAMSNDRNGDGRVAAPVFSQAPERGNETTVEVALDGETPLRPLPFSLNLSHERPNSLRQMVEELYEAIPEQHKAHIGTYYGHTGFEQGLNRYGSQHAFYESLYIPEIINAALDFWGQDAANALANQMACVGSQLPEQVGLQLGMMHIYFSQNGPIRFESETTYAYSQAEFASRRLFDTCASRASDSTAQRRPVNRQNISGILSRSSDFQAGRRTARVRRGY